MKYLPESEQVVSEAIECVEHASMLNAPGADAAALLAESLEKLFTRIDVRDTSLCVSLPAQKSLYRPFELPLADEAKLADLIRFEVRQQIPFPLESVVWDHQLIGSNPTAIASVRECHVALWAIKLDEAHAALAPFRQRGLKVDILTTDAAALFNFVMFERGASSPRSA